MRAVAREDVSAAYTRILPEPHGTRSKRHPPPVFIIQSLNSLASFPSIQRHQRILGGEATTSSSSVSSTSTDTCSNYSRSIHSSHPAGARFVPIKHSISKSVDEVMSASATAHMHRPIWKDDFAECPPAVGTTVASYRDPMDSPSPDQMIPTGFVSKQRLFFSSNVTSGLETHIEMDPSGTRPRSVSSHSDRSDEIAEITATMDGRPRLRSNLHRRPSAPHQSSDAKVIITNVTASEPRRDVPASFYLLRKSEESLSLARKARDGHKGTDGSQEAGASYKTVIKFGRNREIFNEPERPRPHAVLKPAEVRRSTSAVESASSQTHRRESAPTPDLLRVRFPAESTTGHPLSPGSIRRQCDEIYRIVQNQGCQLPAVFCHEGFESGYNTLKEPASLVRMPSMNSLGSKSTPLSPGGGLPPMQHPILNLTPLDHLKPNGKASEIENKEAEIERLQKDLYDAQVCNYRLNHQMGQLVSKDWKREESVLKKNLKDKTAELDALKKRLEKAERDKRVLESRQPPDVQALQGEKRELQIALEREETEKHELFMQINTLIAELADLRGNASAEAANKELHKELDEIKARLQLAEHEKDELQKSQAGLESARRTAQDELFAAKEQLDRVKSMAEIEKQKLKQEITEHQKEVQIKSAALQSLRLAQPSTSKEEVDRLLEDKNSLTRELADVRSQLEQARSEHGSSKQSADTLANQLQSLQEELSRANAKIEVAEQRASEKAVDFEKLRKEFESTRSSGAREAFEAKESLRTAEDQIRQLQTALHLAQKNSDDVEKQAADMEEKLAQAEEQVDQLTEQIRQQEKTNREHQNSVVALEQDLAIAKENVSARDRELQAEQKTKTDVEERLKKLREEVDTVKNEKVSLQEDLHKRQSELLQANSSVQDQQARIKALEKENEKLMEKASVEEELMTLVNSLQEARTRIGAKEAEVTDLRHRLNEQQDETDRIAAELRHVQSSLDRAEEECEKLAGQDVQLTEYRREAEKRLEEVRSELNEELRRAKNENSSLVAELEAAHSAARKLEDEVKDHLASAETRLEALRLAETEKTRLQSRELELTSQLQAVERDLEKSKDESAKKGAELASLKSQLTDRSSSHDSISAEKALLAQKLHELTTSHTTLQADHQTAQEHSATLERQLAALNREKEALEATLLQTTETHSKSSDSSKAEVQQLHLLVNQTKSQLEALTAEKEELATQLQRIDTAKALQEQEFATLRTQLSDLQGKHGLLEAEKKAIESEFFDSQRRAGGTESQVAELRKELAEKEKEITRLTTSALELDVLRTTLDSTHRELDGIKQEEVHLREELRSTKVALEAKEAELIEERTSVSAKHGERETELLAELRGAKEERGRLESALDSQKAEFTADLKKAQDEMMENVRRLTDLLTAEGKRTDAVIKEKEALLTEKAELAVEVRQLKSRLTDLEQELADAQQRPHVNGDVENDVELRRKVSELTEENARLACDLLKQSGASTADDSAALRQQFEQALHQKEKEWERERRRMEEQISERDIDIKALHQAKVDMETDLQRMKLSLPESPLPVPKPRRANTSLTNLTLDTLSERSITPTSDEEEVKKLRNEVDKQKRLIMVLRKKLQQQQLDVHRQGKLSTSTSALR